MTKLFMQYSGQYKPNLSGDEAELVKDLKIGMSFQQFRVKIQIEENEIERCSSANTLKKKQASPTVAPHLIVECVVDQ